MACAITLGDEDKEAWKQYDAVELVKAAGSNALKIPLLVDTGKCDMAALAP